MPNITYPNQRLVKIHRESAKTDFLGIKNENWQAASRDLGAHALQLYLYLASNANNYTYIKARGIHIFSGRMSVK